ncbi:MAG: CPBP family intramembrane glutamic endopeptidase [Acidimicrobiales bacterium]
MRLPDILAPSTEPGEVEDPGTVRRRRVVVMATLGVGAALLGGTLAAPEGSGLFYGLGVLVAATWIAGSLLSGPLHLGRRGGAARGGRQLVAPLVLGAALFLAFAAASLVAQRIPFLAGAVDRVLAKADAGPRGFVLALALVNGVAEEVFFRGALHTAFGRHRAALWATGLYVLVTVATLNLALVAAAVVMGTAFTAERQATRGVLAPVITHVTWSTLILFLLPR